MGSKLLSRGFIQLEKRHGAIYKRVKSALPRRESERKTHPLARHCDILQSIETRLSMLNMTYMRYIDSKVICFIPGKVLDETKSILDVVESNKTPPRTQQLLQELRDLSSMAIEHFDEHILPRCKAQLEQRSGSPEKMLKDLEVVAGSLNQSMKSQGLLFKNLASTSKQPARVLIHPPVPVLAITNELYKLKKSAKTHRHHLKYLTDFARKLCCKYRKQNTKLRIQSAKLREQDRVIQQQNTKIVEQDAALNEIKKHMEEWDQKYKDLTTELVRARDEILIKASSNSSPIINNALLSTPVLNACTKATGSTANNPPFKTNIKPRTTHILPKNYLTVIPERKRKMVGGSEMPLKRNRSPSDPGSSTAMQKFKKDKRNWCVVNDSKEYNINDSAEEKSVESGPKGTIICSFLDLLTNPVINNARIRKRKMAEDIDLK